MRYYSFDEYKEKRDLYGEAWGWPWGKKSQEQGEPPADAAKVARVLTPQQQAQTQGRIGPEQSRMTQQPEKERVSFGRNDLLQVKEAIRDYAGIIQRYLQYVTTQAFPSRAKAGVPMGQNEKNQITNSFTQMVKPAMDKLYAWQGWIDNMVAQATAAKGTMREQYELLLEAIKINYKKFQEIQNDMMNLANAMKGWVGYVSQNVNPMVKNQLEKTYQSYVQSKQTNLGQVLMWMEKKLQKLMAIHNKPYQGLSGEMGYKDDPRQGNLSQLGAAKMQAYKILGLQPNASPQDIKMAFRKLSMQYHPDRNPGDENAQKMYERMQRAYEILTKYPR